MKILLILLISFYSLISLGASSMITPTDVSTIESNINTLSSTVATLTTNVTIIQDNTITNALQIGALSTNVLTSTNSAGYFMVINNTLTLGTGSIANASSGSGVSAPSTWDMDLTWGDLAQATTNDSVGLVSGQLSGQSIYNTSNTVRYASFCTALTNITTATASTAFTVPLGYGGTGAVFYVKQTQVNTQPLVFRLNDSANTLSVTGTVSLVDTETAIPFTWPTWATNAGTVVGIQAIISGASTNVANVRYWGVNRKIRLQK